MNRKLSERAAEDYQLVLRALETEDQLAYTELMNRYRDGVYNTMYKMVRNRDDADDLTIEAFGKAFRKLESYTPNFAFSTWLFKIATNNGIDFIRKQKMKILSIDEPSSPDGDQGYTGRLRTSMLDPEERFMREQRQDILRKLTKQLNEKYQLMIELRYFKELSYQEIAEELDIPIGTVKAQLYRAKELLQEIVKEDTKGHLL